MLKTSEGKLTPAVISTLVYLQSLVEEEEISVFANKDGITVITTEAEYLDPIHLPGKELPNPIANILAHINDEMCSDCLSQDWQFKSPFFINLVEGYVDSLVHTYGLSVPIPYELAYAILKYDLTDYDILAKRGQLGKHAPHEQVILSTMLLESMNKVGYVFYLKVQKEK